MEGLTTEEVNNTERIQDEKGTDGEQEEIAQEIIDDIKYDVKRRIIGALRRQRKKGDFRLLESKFGIS